MYNDIPTDLLRVIEPVVRDHALEVVDAHVRRGKGRSEIQVVVDTPCGDGRVLVDLCAAVSREIGHNLDAEADFLAGAYTLEVCSPGVDRVLAREIDFARVVGRKVEIETRAPLEGRKRFRGELIAFDDATARVAAKQGEVAIPFAQVARAKAFYPADPLGKR